MDSIPFKRLCSDATRIKVPARKDGLLQSFHSAFLQIYLGFTGEKSKHQSSPLPCPLPSRKNGADNSAALPAKRSLCFAKICGNSCRLRGLLFGSLPGELQQIVFPQVRNGSATHLALCHIRSARGRRQTPSSFQVVPLLLQRRRRLLTVLTIPLCRTKRSLQHRSGICALTGACGSFDRLSRSCRGVGSSLVSARHGQQNTRERDCYSGQ